MGKITVPRMVAKGRASPMHPAEAKLMGQKALKVLPSGSVLVSTGKGKPGGRRRGK